MKTLLLLLISASCAMAQTNMIRVRQLWQDPSHEWHGTNGCPTNMPVAIGAINAPFVLMAQVEYSTMTNSLWPEFMFWRSNAYAQFVADREAADAARRLPNKQRLAELLQDCQQFAVFARSNQVGNGMLSNQVYKVSEALARLRPVLIELDRGD